MKAFEKLLLVSPAVSGKVILDRDSIGFKDKLAKDEIEEFIKVGESISQFKDPLAQVTIGNLVSRATAKMVPHNEPVPQGGNEPKEEDEGEEKEEKVEFGPEVNFSTTEKATKSIACLLQLRNKFNTPIFSTAEIGNTTNLLLQGNLDNVDVEATIKGAVVIKGGEKMTQEELFKSILEARYPKPEGTEKEPEVPSGDDTGAPEGGGAVDNSGGEGIEATGDDTGALDTKATEGGGEDTGAVEGTDNKDTTPTVEADKGGVEKAAEDAPVADEKKTATKPKDDKKVTKPTGGAKGATKK